MNPGSTSHPGTLLQRIAVLLGSADILSAPVGILPTQSIKRHGRTFSSFAATVP